MRQRDWIDKSGWAATRALKFIGTGLISLSILGSMLSLLIGEVRLAAHFAIHAVVSALLFAFAIAIGTIVFAPKDQQAE